MRVYDRDRAKVHAFDAPAACCFNERNARVGEAHRSGRGGRRLLRKQPGKRLGHRTHQRGVLRMADPWLREQAQRSQEGCTLSFVNVRRVHAVLGAPGDERLAAFDFVEQALPPRRPTRWRAARLAPLRAGARRRYLRGDPTPRTRARCPAATARADRIPTARAVLAPARADWPGSAQNGPRSCCNLTCSQRNHARRVCSVALCPSSTPTATPR